MASVPRGLGLCFVVALSGCHLIAGLSGGGTSEPGGGDAGQVDALVDGARDGAGPDVPAPDGPLDGAHPDTAQQDTVQPDTAQPDAAQPDAAQPDTLAPDTTGPDTSAPDTQPLPDQSVPDAPPPPDQSVPDAPLQSDIYVPPDGGGCVTPSVAAKCSAGWCEVPAGCFVMGSPTSDPCHASNETQHQVTLTHSFVMAQAETTQDQFNTKMGYNPAYFNKCGLDCPVEGLTWHEAAAYCNALSVAASLTLCYSCSGSGYNMVCTPLSNNPYSCPGYRLPTDAEFEYAERAGTTTSMYNGDLTICNGAAPQADAIGWYVNNGNNTPHPGMAKLANDWGFYDLAGNVSEWTHDGYQSDLGSGAAVDPVTPPGSTDRTFKGGSYKDWPYALRSPSRGAGVAGSIYKNIGFRCVRTLKP